jgi:hypothetical protein
MQLKFSIEQVSASTELAITGLSYPINLAYISQVPKIRE